MRRTLNSTHASGEGWQALLSELTDAELARYGEIAADQKRMEWHLGWLQVLSILVAFCLIGAVSWRLLLGHFDWPAVVLLGLSAALGYWPYRKAKTRRLWDGHCRAVVEEKARRSLDGDAGAK